VIAREDAGCRAFEESSLAIYKIQERLARFNMVPAASVALTLSIFKEKTIFML